MAIFKRNGEKLDYDQSQDLFLEKLYGSLAGRCLLKVLTQPVITELGGAFMNSSLSKGQIKSFVEKNNIDLNLYESQDYHSYNDFFTRTIKEGVRHIDEDESVLIAPCDSKLTVYPIADSLQLKIKNSFYTIEDLLKKSKYRLKDYKIPVIPSSYYIELTEAQDAIREIVKELDKKPIVIKILNIRVDTARDLVFKIYNKTNDMIKIVDMAEKMIVYGNRYRSSYEEIDIALTKAEELFRRGKYKESLDLSTKSISFIDKHIIDSD